MKVPTDEELNRAAAEACGWVRAQFKRSIADSREWIYVQPQELKGYPNTYEAWDGTGPESIDAPRYPNYCQDRNALPELWKAVEEAGQQPEFLNNLRSLTSHGTWPEIVTLRWNEVTAEPRQHVIAALLALGKWQDDWAQE